MTKREDTPRTWQSNTTSRRKIEQQRAFDAQDNVARKVVEYESKVAVFIQGDPAASVLYIEKGGVKVTVLNEVGKEAVVAILGPGDLLGEGRLTWQPERVS